MVENEEFRNKMSQLDDVCSCIYVSLLHGELRFNELYRTVRKFKVVSISKPTLSAHLKHLLERGLVQRRVEDVQNVVYKLSEQALSFEKRENAKRWVDTFINWKEGEGLDSRKYTRELYGKMTEKALEQEVSKDLSYFLLNALYELNTIVDYNVKAGRESNEDFWRFVGNPLYRMFESSVAEKCIDSPVYMKKFLEVLDSLVSKFKRGMNHGKV